MKTEEIISHLRGLMAICHHNLSRHRKALARQSRRLITAYHSKRFPLTVAIVRVDRHPRTNAWLSTEFINSTGENDVQDHLKNAIAMFREKYPRAKKAGIIVYRHLSGGEKFRLPHELGRKLNCRIAGVSFVYCGDSMHEVSI